MYRRPRFLIILFTCIFAIGFPSCGEDYIAFRDIEEVIIYDLETNSSHYTPLTTSSDSIALRVIMKVTSFTHNYIFSQLMNEAWATSPEEPILANEIINIRLYCDKPIYGIPAQTNIMGETLIGYDPSQKFSIGDFLTHLPSKGEYWSFYDMFIFLDGKPTPGSYNFTVEIEDNNGHIFTAPAPTLEWQ